MRKESLCFKSLSRHVFFFCLLKGTEKWLDQNHPHKFWPSAQLLNAANLFTKKESLCLMHRFFLIFSVLSLFLFCFVLFCFLLFFCSLNTWLKNIILSLVPQYKYYLSHVKNIYHLYFLDLFLLFLHSGESIYQLPCLKFIKSQLNWIKHKFTSSNWWF